MTEHSKGKKKENIMGLKGKAEGSRKRKEKKNMAKRTGQEVLSVQHYGFSILPTFQ